MSISQFPPVSGGGIPTGAQSARPSAPVIGNVFYNGTAGYLEIYNGTNWIPSSAVPGQPTITVSDVGTNAAFGAAQALVTVTPASDNVSVTARKAYATSGGYIGNSTTAGVVVTVAGNGSYSFYGTTFSPFGESSGSAVSSATLTTVPQAPTIGTATVPPGTTTVTVTWTIGAGNGGKVLTSQTVTAYSGTTPVSSATASSTATTIDIAGLTGGIPLTFKVKSTNANGDSLESASSNSVTIPTIFTADYLVVAGGGPGGQGDGNTGGGLQGGGGAGGVRCTVTVTGGGASLPSALSVSTGTNYTVTVGAGGSPGSNGSASVFSNVNTVGGGRGGFDLGSNFWPAQSGGSGGGAGNSGSANASASSGGGGTTAEGYSGGNTANRSNFGNFSSAGGGGAAGFGNSVNFGTTFANIGNGGDGITTNITGSALSFGGGGGGSKAGSDSPTNSAGAGGLGGGGAGGNTNATRNGVSGTAGTGGGGGGAAGATANANSGSGGSGIVILRYPNTRNITVGNGLTATTNTTGNNKVTTFNAGTGTVSWS